MMMMMMMMMMIIIREFLCRDTTNMENKMHDYTSSNRSHRRSQWPSGLRCVSTADRLLGMRVPIPPGAWMIVRFECYVCCQVEVSATG